jgi:chromosome transmission fidelity protein 1
MLLILQPKAALLDDEGNDLSEFLPDTSLKQGLRDTASPGNKRAAPDAGSYSSSSSEDEAADTAQDADTEEAAAIEERRQPQVIFCSRTHSQLSQFVGELHRTRFGSSVLLVAVASRKALCVNDEVRQVLRACTRAMQRPCWQTMSHALMTQNKTPV